MADTVEPASRAQGVAQSIRRAAVLKYSPALFKHLKGYTAADLRADLVAGTNVAFVALPLCIALAMAAGVPPQAGLYTAIAGGIFTAAFGGSRHAISGPTAAFVVILAPICAQRGLEGLMVASIMSGVILLIMGFSGLGSLIKYVPYPVTAGFTAGIAVAIATAQLKDFLGLDVHYDAVRQVTQQVVVDGKEGLFTQTLHLNASGLPLPYHEKLVALFHGVIDTSGSKMLHAVAIGLTGLAMMFLYPKHFPRIARRLPVPLATVLACVGLSMFCSHVLGWRDIAMLNEFPRGLPAFNTRLFSEANWSYANLSTLVIPATAIAMLCAIASLLSVVVADGMAGTRHDSNSELIGQGLGNIVSPLFGGIAISGAVARTVTNVSSGGRTPVASIIHSVLLLVILLIFAPFAQYIPLACLSAILLHVSFNMFNFRHFRHLLSAPRGDVFVLLTCLLLTVFVDMAAAVMAGMIMAAMLFMKRMSDITSINPLESPTSDIEMQMHAIAPQDIPRGVTIYSVDGPFFFGASEKALEAMDTLGGGAKIVVMRLNRVPAMDATGMHALERVLDHLTRRRVKLILSGLHAPLREKLERVGFLDKLGRENVTPDIEWALVRCYEILGPDARNRPTGKTGMLRAPVKNP
jgi:sulfate permease, SulP family